MMLLTEKIDKLPGLHLAALKGDLGAIQTAVETGEPINGRSNCDQDHNGFPDNSEPIKAAIASLTPLMIAAGSQYSSVSAVKLLMALGANPLLKSDGGTSAIWYAARVDIDRLRLLLEAGADPNETLRNGLTLIGETARAGNSEAVQLLLSVGVSLKPILTSLESMFIPVRDTSYLSKSPEDNTKAIYFQIPLFRAAQSGSASTVQLLLDAGASPTMRDAEGRTALFYATSPEVVTVLLKAGCPLDTVDGYDFSEIDKALDNHHADVVRSLVVAGATLGTTDIKPTSSLMRFCMSQEIDPEMVQLLIDLGADIYERAFHQRTALHEAVQRINGDREGKLGDVVRILVNAGLPVDVRDEDNNTPLHIAVGSEGFGQDISAVNALLDLGANVNAINLQGETPLIVATASNAPEIVSILLKHGAS